VSSNNGQSNSWTEDDGLEFLRGSGGKDCIEKRAVRENLSQSTRSFHYRIRIME
jgi:hypothetical protein